jgi:NADPH:quinone reductase-like Zn-dependent oxidoreductase
MPKAVQFNEYGPINVLQINEVSKPSLKETEVLIAVKAAGINPGEDKIREGLMHSQWPATFPSGEGTDFAGVVEAIGSAIKQFSVGDNVAGYTHNRASHAEYVVANEENLVLKPDEVSWEVAGSLFVAGTTAVGALNAVSLQTDETIVVSGAAGGVGAIIAQLAAIKGGRVFGIAGAHDSDWLSTHNITPINYDDNVADEIKRQIGTPNAFIDTIGKGYVKMALDLGVSKDRIDTIIDFQAAGSYGVKAEGSAAASSIDVLSDLLQKIADGVLEVPIAKTFPLDKVQDAFTFITTEHHRGKVVLIP